MKILLAFLFLVLSLNISAQIKHKKKLPTYFGIEFSPVFPTSFIGEKTLTLNQPLNDPFNLSTTITQKMGFSIGGTVRTSFTKFIALETGLNYTKRNFDITMALPDSSISANTALGFIQYSLPINALFYIKLDQKWYMDASLGFGINFSPTSVGKTTQPRKKQVFYHLGYVEKKIGFDLNANLGFEFRTEKSGFFYLGGSARVPLQPLFHLYMQYSYETSATEKVLDGYVDGSFLAIQVKYFFPNIKNKGTQFNKGPIEQ